MIIEAVMNAIAFLLLGVIRLFPAIPHIDTSHLDGVIKVISLIDTFVSIRIIAVCFGIVFLFMNIRTVWSVIMWVVRKIPGIS